MRKNEPAQVYGPVTQYVLLDYFGRYLSGEVVSVRRVEENGVALTWYTVSTGAGVKEVALSLLTMIPES
jgi:hypothetical protein